MSLKAGYDIFVTTTPCNITDLIIPKEEVLAGLISTRNHPNFGPDFKIFLLILSQFNIQSGSKRIAPYEATHIHACIS